MRHFGTPSMDDNATAIAAYLVLGHISDSFWYFILMIVSDSCFFEDIRGYIFQVFEPLLWLAFTSKYLRFIEIVLELANVKIKPKYTA